MAKSSSFHHKQFDEATLVKLEIFETYATEWLPVFLCPHKVYCDEVHIYDFFAGPGTDSKGNMGSPLRLLKQLKVFLRHPSIKPVKVYVHFYDNMLWKIERLKACIKAMSLELPAVTLDVRRMPFAEAFNEARPVLARRKSAKLLIIDQYGTKHISNNVFATLTESPVCDFLFFVSSATLNRFKDVPAISQKITRPEDPNHVHRAAFNYYQDQLPKNKTYYLAPFSIRKPSGNIYGLVFGTAKPLGIEKFLTAAWAKDKDNGEANFDINRDGSNGQTSIFSQKLKLELFGLDLEEAILNGQLKNEFEISHFCYKQGVLRKHAKPILEELKKSGLIETEISSPRPIAFQKEPRSLRIKK